MNNMTSYISDETKILILYIIKDLELEDIKKIIWEKIFDFEDELLSTNWIEDELKKLLFRQLLFRWILYRLKMLEYIQRVREKQSWLYEEINYKNQLRRGREQLKERLIWIDKTIK